MRELYLARFAHTPYGVFGRLRLEEIDLYTVENPWLNNEPRISCIPQGVYDLELGMYNRGGYAAYELQDVPGRSLVKIHISNTASDVEGCIGVGTKLGWVENQWAVLNSRRAYRQFMEKMGEAAGAKLWIIWDLDPEGGWEG